MNKTIAALSAGALCLCGRSWALFVSAIRNSSSIVTTRRFAATAHTPLLHRDATSSPVSNR